LQGFKRANLSDTKRKEEKQLQQFIEGNASLNTKYGTVIPRIDALYTDIMKYANRNIWISQIYNLSPLVQTAATLANLKLAYQNLPNEAAKKDFLANQQANIKKEFGKSIGRYDVNLDQLTMVKMLSDAATFNKDNMLPSVKKLLKGSTSVDEIGKRVDELFSKSKLSRAAEVNALIDGDLNALLTYNDELVTFASELSDEMAIIEIENKTRNSELSQLMASLGLGFIVGYQFVINNRVSFDFFGGPAYQILLAENKTTTNLSTGKYVENQDETLLADAIPNRYIKGYGLRGGVTIGFLF
jgi:hypothetical protein